MVLQKEALIQLLSDDDEQTVRLVKESLATNGSSIIPDLQDLSLCDNPIAALHARDILHDLMQKEATERFEILCSNFNDHSDLENTCWLLAETLIRGVNTFPYRQRLTSWGTELERRLHNAESARQRVLITTDFLANKLGFTGNTEDYYNAGNSLLPHVMDSRQGIPVSLTLVYIFVGHHAGIPIEGVNLPGHFLARHEDIIFDPFHNGRILSRKDCEEILMRQNKQLQDWHLSPATPHQMLTRILANLLYTSNKSGMDDLYANIKHWTHLLHSPR